MGHTQRVGFRGDCKNDAVAGVAHEGVYFASAFLRRTRVFRVGFFKRDVYFASGFRTQPSNSGLSNRLE